ncbi:MAG TPA: cyanophycinase [Candidatus Avimonas sp.]|nr:cyanophycinase [Candidatus Avimonas sp.]HQA16538.1 cyanophycinase [Candidatus Avimonas sp.]HQD38578.1 cyanophycinase [Candidatus Avimonas sp.]
METNKGYLIVIGGAEDKKGDSVILKQAPQMLSKGEILTVLTTATEQPEETGRIYHGVFTRLGMDKVQILNINTRKDANQPDNCRLIESSRCLFMTGGDQLRITSILGGTRAYEAIKELYRAGGIIMGTSAGAAVMSSTMIVEGNDNQPARKCTLKMAPGLGLFDGVIIDQHFDQRGRFGRLMCAVAENPDVLGIGIDEDTAIKLYPDMHFEVIGSNAVTIIDGKTILSSNVSELRPNEILAITEATVHVIPQGYGFDLKSRKVKRMKDEE